MNASRRRVTTIVVTFGLLVGAAALAVYRAGGPAARHAGAELYIHRNVVDRVRAAVAKPPQVVWAGDSTLQSVPQFPSYVGIVQEELLDPAHVTSLMLASPAMDFYSYWSLAGRIAALHPQVVVLIANLRTFMPEGGIRSLSDLMAEIDLADLPETFVLPYYVRGMTAPGVLLARALRTRLGEDVFLTFEGVRREVQDAKVWSRLGPETPQWTPMELFGRFIAGNDRLVTAFDRPLERGNPLVRFARATIARLAADGTTILVVVTPMPWERATEIRHYDPARFAARIDMLRSVVEASGGRLIDLHHALEKRYFRDGDCHFTPEGAAVMARLVEPHLRAALVERGLMSAASP